MPFQRVAIVGTGLIGGSFGLAVRRHFPAAVVVGFDREEVLKRALALGAVQKANTDLAEALRGADLVYIALRVGATIEMLPSIAAAASPNALVTDACSAKAMVCKAAEPLFKAAARFLGGHPMAGKETSGIDNADAGIFAGAPYALIGSENDPDPRLREFAALLRTLGAIPVWCDIDTHDWAVGIVSHLPQLVALALARVVQDETDETGLPLALAGKGLQDTLRLAGSPYSVWRDILMANRENVVHALDRLAQNVDHLRRNLASKDLEEEFRVANDLFRALHPKQDKNQS